MKKQPEGRFSDVFRKLFHFGKPGVPKKRRTKKYKKKQKKKTRNVKQKPAQK